MTLVFNVTVIVCGWLIAMLTADPRPMLTAGIAAFAFCMLDRIARAIESLKLRKP